MPALSDRIPYQALADRPKLRLPGGARLAVEGIELHPLPVLPEERN